MLVVTQGDALRACPGLLYIAPLALPFDFEAKPIKVLLTIHAQHRSDYLLGAIWPGCLQIVRPIARTTDKLEN